MFYIFVTKLIKLLYAFSYPRQRLLLLAVHYCITTRRLLFNFLTSIKPDNHYTANCSKHEKLF